MTITPGYYRTRGGNKARVLCTDAPAKHSCVGYIEQSPGIIPESWTVNGQTVTEAQTPGDLISPWIDAPVVDWSKEREWVKAVAMDKAGTWFRYDGLPVIDEDWSVWISDGPYNQRMHPSEYPQFTGDWKDSLYIRPEGGVK